MNFNWLKRFLIKTLFSIAFITIGILIFNYMIMPHVTGLRQTIKTPDVVGMSESKARVLLSYFKLRMSIVGYVYSYMDEGVVVKQRPRPASDIKEGRVIDVWISKGPERKVMPSVKNLPLQDGIDILLKAGINADNIVEIDTTVIELSGKIKETDPPEGTFIPENGSVVVYVYKYSKGIPDLSGLTLNEAKKILKKEGIPLKSVVYEDGVNEGVVINQYPEPGKPVSVEDSVVITIGSSIE